MTVSLVSPDLVIHMLILFQIPGSSARTARSSATPKSAAPNHMLMRTAELVPMVVASILLTPLPMLGLAVMTGTTAPADGNATGFC